MEGFIAANATTRLANFLLDCAIRFGKKDKENAKITLPLPLILVCFKRKRGNEQMKMLALTYVFAKQKGRERTAPYEI